MKISIVRQKIRSNKQISVVVNEYVVNNDRLGPSDKFQHIYARMFI